MTAQEQPYNIQVIYKVHTNMRVSRETYVNGEFRVWSHAGEYIYFDSEKQYVFVNYELANENKYTRRKETPGVAANRGHTPFEGVQPVREEFVFRQHQAIVDRLGRL